MSSSNRRAHLSANTFFKTMRKRRLQERKNTRVAKPVTNVPLEPSLTRLALSRGAQGFHQPLHRFRPPPLHVARLKLPLKLLHLQWQRTDLKLLMEPFHLPLKLGSVEVSHTLELHLHLLHLQILHRHAVLL